MKQIFMCKPYDFNVKYEINKWMDGKVGHVSPNIAEEQWDKLYSTLKMSNDIIVLPNNNVSLPDIVFTANAGFLFNDKFVTSSFANYERQPESKIYSNFFTNIGYSVDNYFINNSIPFEGAGDILISTKHKTVSLAYGFRTSYESYKYINQIIINENPNYELLHLKLIDPKFYHLDTCFCPTELGHILYYPQAFDYESIQKLVNKFGNDLIPVATNDAELFVCNAVSYGNHLVVNDISEKLGLELKQKGYQVLKSPMSEFIKSGGSCKCLTLNMQTKI